MREAPGTAVASVGTALSGAVAALRAVSTSTPRLDAEVLVAHVVERDRSWVLAHPEVPLTPEQSAALDAVVRRRAAGEPVAYIRGFKEWHALRIRTDRRALIPRPETELLLEAAVAEIAERMTSEDRPIVAWDVATGSGALATALALRFRSGLRLGRVRLIASDIADDALELAAENLAAHGVESLADLACADLLAPAGRSMPRPDVVVANLPYVPTADVDLRAGSLAHEPRLALDGGPDGLGLIGRVLADLPRAAGPDATVLLEVGAAQADAAAALIPVPASVSTLADLRGIERIVRIRLGGAGHR